MMSLFLWLLHLDTEAFTFSYFVTEALLHCGVVDVAVAKLKTCRVPSSAQDRLDIFVRVGP